MRKKPKRRNPIAKALRQRQYKARRVANKGRKPRDWQREKDAKAAMREDV